MGSQWFVLPVPAGWTYLGSREIWAPLRLGSSKRSKIAAFGEVGREPILPKPLSDYQDFKAHPGRRLPSFTPKSSRTRAARMPP